MEALKIDNFYIIIYYCQLLLEIFFFYFRTPNKFLRNIELIIAVKLTAISFCPYREDFQNNIFFYIRVGWMDTCPERACKRTQPKNV